MNAHATHTPVYQAADVFVPWGKVTTVNQSIIPKLYETERWWWWFVFVFFLNKTLPSSIVVEQIIFNKNFKWVSYWEVNVQIIADVSSCNKIQETLSGMWVL